MSKVYLPHADQFDAMNENLARIANALSSDIDISTWAGVQRAVRLGLAPDLFPIGTQLIVPHSTYGDMVYDVVAHNYFKSAKDKNAYTMTLMSHSLYVTCQFDSQEAFYYADAELPTGTYHFTIPESFGAWRTGTYQFTLQESLPKGGQLCINDTASALSLTSLKILSYESPTDTELTYASGISEGSGGTNLGTFGVELNHMHRVAYGSGNYKESAIRQFLNSSAEAGSVWTSQTKFDRPPSWVSSLAGFEKGIDADFLAIVGEVVVPCAANNTYESPDSTTTKGEKYTVVDKFYLASQTEIIGMATESVVDDSVLFPYYEETTNADRIKYRNGVAEHWWGRSPTSWQSGCVRIVYPEGKMDNYFVFNNHECVPVCTIV